MDLEKLLEGKIGGNNSLFAQLFGDAQRRIGQTTDRNIRGIQQQGAQSGFRGINANQINNAYRSESDALGQVSGNIGQMQLQDQNFAISKLLELDAMPSWWESILGSLIGGGAQVGAAALTGGASSGMAAMAGSDERIKENIKKIGKRGDIDIVEFNYIGNPQRFRGVTAQQIEANHPEAVREINGIKFVDYSKIDVKMEAI